MWWFFSIGIGSRKSYKFYYFLFDIFCKVKKKNNINNDDDGWSMMIFQKQKIKQKPNSVKIQLENNGFIKKSHKKK